MKKKTSITQFPIPIEPAFQLHSYFKQTIFAPNIIESNIQSIIKVINILFYFFSQYWSEKSICTCIIIFDYLLHEL